MRDSQRSRVYKAENSTVCRQSVSREAIKRLVNGRKVRTTGNVDIKECQAYLDYVLTSAKFQSRWGRRHIEVRHKTNGAATGGGGVICLPPPLRTEGVILHELAHCLTPTTEAHGPLFAATLLTLVRLFMGEQAGRDLAAAFSTHRVKYRSEMSSVPKAGTHPVVLRPDLAKARRAAEARDKAHQTYKSIPDAIQRRDALVVLGRMLDLGLGTTASVDPYYDDGEVLMVRKSLLTEVPSDQAES
jgi:putative metallohydrolase (TIGR04338 family)